MTLTGLIKERTAYIKTCARSVLAAQISNQPEFKNSKCLVDPRSAMSIQNFMRNSFLMVSKRLKNVVMQL